MRTFVEFLLSMPWPTQFVVVCLLVGGVIFVATAIAEGREVRRIRDREAYLALRGDLLHVHLCEYCGSRYSALYFDDCPTCKPRVIRLRDVKRAAKTGKF